MISSNEIQNRLLDAFAGSQSLDEFEDWFVSNSWNVHQSNDFDLQRLVFAIELRLAERSSGHLAADQLLQELKNVVRSIPVNGACQRL